MRTELFEILKCVVTLLSMIICYLIIPFVRTKLHGTRYEVIANEALQIVMSLQQQYPTHQNDSYKHDIAIKLIKDAGKRIGLTLTNDQASTLLEAAVFQMKK